MKWSRLGHEAMIGLRKERQTMKKKRQKKNNNNNNNNNNKFILTKIYISRFVVSIVLRTFIDSLDARMGYYPKGFPCPL